MIFVLQFQPDIVEYDGHLSMRLQHAFAQVEQPQFLDRGAVQIQSIRTGAVSLQQPPLSSDDIRKLRVSSDHDSFDNRYRNIPDHWSPWLCFYCNVYCLIYNEKYMFLTFLVSIG